MLAIMELIVICLGTECNSQTKWTDPKLTQQRKNLALLDYFKIQYISSPEAIQYLIQRLENISNYIIPNPNEYGFNPSWSRLEDLDQRIKELPQHMKEGLQVKANQCNTY
ncbi:hypothetical protein FGO68_gene16412 [Halteria grandinella]|uniref:Uncharacterized protein n=1 Tax=Halteria grandinella TaxID=5974 RepID=A0A8J8NDN8_HALGN|nr:hypothetical protein FGO68_gene16412 [Halteria grandinella]